MAQNVTAPKTADICRWSLFYLIAWVTAAWITVLPQNDGVYHVLAYLTAAIGLLGSYFSDTALDHSRHALTGTLLLAMSLPFSTLAIKFNANTVMPAAWPRPWSHPGIARPLHWTIRTNCYKVLSENYNEHRIADSPESCRA